MGDFPVHELIEMQKRWKEIYDTFEVSGMGERGIHVQLRAIPQIAPVENWTLNIDRGDTTYPYEHSITLDGVKFFAISVHPLKTKLIIQEEEE